MDSLPALQESLNQILDALKSNVAQLKPSDGLNRVDLDVDVRSPSNINAAAVSAVSQSPELLSRIFLFALSSDVYPAISPNLAPLNISHVCKSWRNGAIGTPSLWVSFSLTFEGGKESKNHLFTLFRGRSSGLPLSMKLVFGTNRSSRLSEGTVFEASRVLLNITRTDFSPIANLYVVVPPNFFNWFIPALIGSPHSKAMRSFAIDIFGNCDEQSAIQDVDLQIMANHPHLESLILLNHTIASIPYLCKRLRSLRRLVLVYDFLPGCETGYRTRLNTHHCLRALYCCPSLEEFCLSLHWSAVSNIVNSNIRSRCIPSFHNKLKKLCIIAGDSDGNLDFLLGKLRLRRLRSFELRSRSTAILSTGFRKFIEEGSMLEEVALYGRNTPASGILENLRLLPNLKHLILVQPPQIISYLQALSYHPIDSTEQEDGKPMCRELESLTIEESPGNSLPLDELSHFIRSRCSVGERTVLGTIKHECSARLKLLRVPASQAKGLLGMEGVRNSMESGLNIEQYEEEYVTSPAYLSGKDFFHL